LIYFWKDNSKQAYLKSCSWTKEPSARTPAGNIALEPSARTPAGNIALEPSTRTPAGTISNYSTSAWDKCNFSCSQVNKRICYKRESPVYRNWILLFFVWEKLSGTALFEVTDMIYVETGQRDKWREFGTKVVS
jgi:hypothetical protein